MGRLNLSEVTTSWRLFTKEEKRNIAIYICGIMLYKFGLEAFNGSITALATNRYDWEAWRSDSARKTFERVGLLQGLNQAFQCVGAILIGPLIKRYPTKAVLSCAICCFGVLTAILMIVDASTGGTLKPSGWEPTNEDDFGYYGSYNTDGIIPIYCVSGIAYGMVELIRRVIPRDIVGGNVQKLLRMDALVHIFYEIAGTSGAFCTALALIPRFGNNFSFIITPIFFTLASVVWFFVSDLGYTRDTSLQRLEKKKNYFVQAGESFLFFGKSVYLGGKILLTNRRYIWLLPGYSVALYGHRYLENGVAPQIARRYLGNSAWSQIMVGGSNFGELLGALFVFLFTNFIQTPIPWLRLDALTLLIVWYLPYWYPRRGVVEEAWKVAATFIPISFGWAAGDVSLAAYIQASLARIESQNREVSALGSVMAFLYSYIVMYAIAQPLLGRYVDSVYEDSGETTIRPAIQNIAGVHFTVIAAVVISATFIPKGSLAINPKMLNDEQLDSELDKPDPRASTSDEEDLKKYHHNGTLDDRRESVTRTNVDVNDTFSPDMTTIAEHEKTTVTKA